MFAQQDEWKQGHATHVKLVINDDERVTWHFSLKSEVDKLGYNVLYYLKVQF